MKRIITSVTTALLFILIYGNGYSVETKPPVTPPQQHDADELSLSGKVIETMNGGSYTYVYLEKKGKKTWVAVPLMEVKVGQNMAFMPGSEMRNFSSKTLNRTFESIYFSGGPMAISATKTAAAPHDGSKSTAAPAAGGKISVEKAAGPNAYTVGEIFAKKISLDKKTAVVRGKVVKVSTGIMGKNWFHIQDGTGDSAKSTHNLVVTSQDSPAVGDVVTVKGTLYKDKDFGAGYKYDIIMEQAKIQR